MSLVSHGCQEMTLNVHIKTKLRIQRLNILSDRNEHHLKIVGVAFGSVWQRRLLAPSDFK